MVETVGISIDTSFMVPAVHIHRANEFLYCSNEMSIVTDIRDVVNFEGYSVHSGDQGDQASEQYS